jgi:hypothetical protein
MLLCCAACGKGGSKEGSKQGSPSTPGRLEPASKLAKASEETSKQMCVCVCVSLKTYFRLVPEDNETHILFTRKTENGIFQIILWLINTKSAERRGGLSKQAG